MQLFGKITTILLGILLCFAFVSTEHVYANADIEYQYDYWSEGRYLSYPIYPFYSTGRYHVEEDKVSDIRFFGCVFYTPSTGEIPGPTEKWDNKPKVTGDLAFIRIPKVTGIKTASYTCLQPGDKVAVEVQSDAVGSFSAAILSKQSGKWIEVECKTVTASESSSNESAIVEYIICDNDKEIAVVGRLLVRDASTGKDTSDGVGFLIDVGSPRLHLSMRTIGCFIAICFAITVALSIKSLNKRKH